MPAFATPPEAHEHGEIVIRTMAMPADTNANGDIFGGWLMAQMDLGGAVLARNVAGTRVVTVTVDRMTFVAPVYVGDLVTCYARLTRVGRSSLQVDVEAWVQRFRNGDEYVRVTEGLFTYVAIDENGRPRAVRHRTPPVAPS